MSHDPRLDGEPMMRERVARKLRSNPQLVLFLLAVFALGASNGIFQTTYNNYLDDVFNIGATARGALELPREFPGFLVALLAGALFFLRESHVAALAAACTGIGLIGLGLVDARWGWMLAFTIIWSIGQHVEMPMRSALAMGLGTARQHGRRLGQTSAARVGATVFGGLLVWLIIDYVGNNWTVIFLVGGAAALAGALIYLRLRPPATHHQRAKLVVRRRYSLYYALCALFGARKQVFITFAPWVLVTVYGQEASTFAKLWIASAMLGVWFQQGLGDLIDRWGERRVLMLDGALLVLICLGYGFADRIGLPPGWPVRILYACYVLDQLLFGVENARSSYLAKIAERPQDVSASLSMGISINHAVSMIVPYIGGRYIWDVYGWQWVFVAAAGLSVLTIIAASCVRVPGDASDLAEKQREAEESGELSAGG